MISRRALFKLLPLLVLALFFGWMPGVRRVIDYRLFNLPKARRVIFPMFEISSCPTISLGEIKSRRFTLIDRSSMRARAEVQAAEDARVFAALDNI